MKNMRFINLPQTQIINTYATEEKKKHAHSERELNIQKGVDLLLFYRSYQYSVQIKSI